MKKKMKRMKKTVHKNYEYALNDEDKTLEDQ